MRGNYARTEGQVPLQKLKLFFFLTTAANEERTKENKRLSVITYHEASIAYLIREVSGSKGHCKKV
jgi:hypothetical protein